MSVFYNFIAAAVFIDWNYQNMYNIYVCLCHLTAYMLYRPGNKPLYKEIITAKCVDNVYITKSK